MSPMFFPFSLTVVTSVVFCAAAMHSTLNSYGSYSESNPSLHMRLNPIDSNFGDSRTGQDRYIYERVPQDQHNRRTEPDSYLNLWDMRNPIEPVVSTRSLYPMELDKEDSNRPHSDGTPQVAMFDGTNADLQTKELMASGLLKNKRESHSLSIVNPLDVLRQRLMLEMARRRMKENQDQIRANDVILKTLGKRSSDAPFATSSKDPDDDDEDDEKRLGEGGGARSADRRRSQRRGYMNRQQDSSAVDFEV